MLQTQTVAKDTLALIKRLMAESRLNDFTLVGGTALALKLGHRISIDIDLFSTREFDSGLMAEWLKSKFNATDIQTVKNSVFCYVDNIKLDFITHAYPEVAQHEIPEGIRMMSLTDIAAMKLHAIVQSGNRLKDFTDVYFLLEQMPLSTLYAAYEQKYFPDASAEIARLALNDTSCINLADKIQLLDRSFDWKVIKERLRAAIESPQKTFADPTDNEKVLSFHSPGQTEQTDDTITVLAVRPIQNETLISYLQEHEIPLGLAQKFCSEVDFLSDNKQQSAIGFKNIAGGFELRSNLFEGSSLPRDITLFDDNKDQLCVFNNFFDFLSFATIRQNLNVPLLSCLVLNDPSLLEKNRSLMERHRKVFLFLPWDKASRADTEKALSWNSGFNVQKYSDASRQYWRHKSLNGLLIAEQSREQQPSKGIRRKH